MGIFGSAVNLNNVTGPSAGGYYFLAGDYEVEITTVKKVQTRGKGPLFVAETLVEETSTPERPVGSRPNWAQLLEGKAVDIAPQNVKMFLTACAGLNIFDAKDAKAIAAFDWDSFAETAIGESNPLRGCKIHVQAVDSKNKAGGAFTKHVFTPGKNLSEFQAKLLKKARELSK